MRILERLFVFLLLCAVVTLPVHAQTDPYKKGLDALSVDVVKAQLEFLASDWTDGRETGQKGSFLAADYLASQFKILGIQPAGDYQVAARRRQFMFMGPSGGGRPERVRTYFQNLPLIQYEPGNEQQFALVTRTGNGEETTTFGYRTDYSVTVSTTGITVSAPVVFVGYGLTDEKNNYDDFKGVDVKGKFILRLSGFPGYKDTASAAYKKFRPPDQGPFPRRGGPNRNERLQQLGVAGVIDVIAGQDPSLGWATNYPFRFNTENYEGDVPLNPSQPRMALAGDTLRDNITVVQVTSRVANELVRGSGIDLSSFDEQVMKTVKPASKSINGKAAFLKTTVKSSIVQARNVVGMIEGENPKEILVVGAHYDHLGNRGGYIYNGADDNASGTIAVMSIARACAAAGVKPKRTIVFAAWVGEEQGLLGSQFFVQRPPVPVKDIQLNVNYDMIGRNSLQDSAGTQCGMTFTEGFPLLKEVTERQNRENNLGLALNIRSSQRPGGGSDHASFAAVNVPVMSWMAAMHAEYHQPGDQVEKINYDKMTKIIKLGFLNVWELANAEKGLR
jgi:hypothetical protein